MSENNNSLLYLIAITMIPGIGNTNAKKLISWIDSPEALFREPEAHIMKIPGMPKILSQGMNRKDLLLRAEKEFNFILSSGISSLYFYDDDYPERLKHCADSPLILYYKGIDNISHKRVLAVVGTRKATSYGYRMCEEIIQDFRHDDILIVSGMAYGIDSCAHQKALANGISTVGILAHGLDRIYPQANRNMARRMLDTGGLITEFMSETNPDRENFPKRNRIIAGMSDAVLVVESKTKGGAVITADIAHSYNRDVFAVPGRSHDEFSDGCHLLIRRNIAALARSADDIKYSMGWEGKEKLKQNKLEILNDHSEDEQKVLSIIIDKDRASIDEIVLISGLGASTTASILLKLEFSGVISGLPGKMYEVRR